MESEVQKGGEALDIADVLKEQGELEKAWRGAGMDWLLQKLVTWTNMTNRQHSITLHTPAGVVSGTIITHQAYFEAFADEYIGSSGGELVEKLRSMLVGFGIPDPEDQDPHSDPQYIHLKDAQFFAPGQNPMPANGILWRGKISAVCSFHLGRLGAA